MKCLRKRVGRNQHRGMEEESCEERFTGSCSYEYGVEMDIRPKR